MFHKQMSGCGKPLSRQTARQELRISAQARLILLYYRSFQEPEEIEKFLKAVSICKIQGHENIKLIIAGANHFGWNNEQETFALEGMINRLGMNDYTNFLNPIDYPQLPMY